jgi:hypothetical protein
MKTQPLFIAEASSNQGRDLARGLAFVDAVADAGCGAVKFQLFKIARMFAPEILRQCPKHRARAEWELPPAHLPQKIAPEIAHIRESLIADGSGFKGPQPSELSDWEWRADHDDGMRPLKHIRLAYKGEVA